ncbi:Zinc finger MYND domain-containing protein 11 [Sarcoptes scabiei]|nr:Zinc finger MYND domain-containing protein 11 [Sarcoptes scabiei]
MFKKSNRQFQQRITRRTNYDSDESEELNQSDSNQTSLTNDKLIVNNSNSNANILSDHINECLQNKNGLPDSIQKRNAKPYQERKTKLSFVEDIEEEEQDVFVIKKSSYSRRMDKIKRKLLKSKSVPQNRECSENDNLDDSTVSLQTNVVNNDLKGLKIIDSLATRQTSNANTDESSHFETTPNEIVYPTSADELEQEDQDDGEDGRDLSVESQKMPQFRSALERGTIPDARTIYELKKQRQKLARSNASDDYIPLSKEKDSNEPNESTSKISKRLIRESDDDLSDDEHGHRNNNDLDENIIKFGDVDRYQTTEKERFRKNLFDSTEDNATKSNNDGNEQTSSDEDGTDAEKDDSEDEIERWEREKIRKAVRLPSNIFHSVGPSDEMTNLNQSGNDINLIHRLQAIHDNNNVVPIEIDQTETKSIGHTLPPYITERIAKSDRQQFTLSGFNDRIHKAKQQIESAIEENQQLLDRIAMNSELTTKEIDSYATEVEALTEDYNLYRSMYDYVCNLCDCINDKIEKLEQYEKQAQECWKNHTKLVLDRHKFRIQDHNSIALYLIMNHQALSLQNFNQTSQTLNSILDIYDFGEDQSKRIRCYSTLEQMKSMNFKNFPLEIDSDDDDDDANTQNYHATIETIESSLKLLFEDTDEDFVTIKMITERFKHWKTKRLETYQESFVSEFLPKFLTFYLRHNLCLWNPFDENSQSSINLFDTDCFKDLIRYVMSQNRSDSTDQYDEIALIPSLMESTIIPRLIQMVENVWNPLSSRQTKSLQRILVRILQTIPSLIDTSENLPILFEKIVSRLESTIDNDIFLPQLIPVNFFSDHNAEQRSYYETIVIEFVRKFFEYQYWEAAKIMMNVIEFRSLIDDQILQELVLDKICSRYLLTSIQRSSSNALNTIKRIELLLQALPKEWLSKREGNFHQNFQHLLQQLLEQKRSIENDEIREKLVKFCQESLRS